MGFTDRIKKAGVISAALALPVGAAQKDEPVPTANAIVSADDDEVRLEKYKAAYDEFVNATDKMLEEMALAKGTIVSKVLSGKISLQGGINISLALSKDGQSLEECTVYSRDGGDKLSFPSVATMFNRYRDLCRAKNNVPANAAFNNSFINVPDSKSIAGFIYERLPYITPARRPSQSDVANIVNKISSSFRTLCALTGTSNAYLGERNSASSLLWNNSDNNKVTWTHDAGSSSITLFGEDRKAIGTIAIPPREELLEIQANLDAGSNWYKSINEILAYPPIKERTVLRVLFIEKIMGKDVPCEIIVKNTPRIEILANRDQEISR